VRHPACSAALSAIRGLDHVGTTNLSPLIEKESSKKSIISAMMFYQKPATIFFQPEYAGSIPFTRSSFQMPPGLRIF
jgi:hypothetical protein